LLAKLLDPKSIANRDRVVGTSPFLLGMTSAPLHRFEPSSFTELGPFKLAVAKAQWVGIVG